jgi:hypothetical protein
MSSFRWATKKAVEDAVSVLIGDSNSCISHRNRDALFFDVRE